MGVSMKRIFSLFIGIFSLILFSSLAWSHGVVEKPASREQFCGVESKPDEIYSKKMTHEECRPIMTKSDGSLDNSIYNFMAVLTHTTGRQGRTSATLPKNVCGFDAETWGGGKTPWDTAINWPVNLLSAGNNQFVWNISWGNHFGDTEEFAYWITKPGFVFSANKELTWNDFEEKPFCLLKYDDTKPTANPNIVPDKANNKFITTCNVPARANRSVIYAEWGRNRSTFERFHSCIDIVFSGQPIPSTTKAVISSLPSTVAGASEVVLDGSQSQGKDLSYQWTISASDPSYYTLIDSNKAVAKLSMKNVIAEQRIVVNLAVKSGEFSDNASTNFLHQPLANDVWRNIGSALNNATLKAGDKISLRIIDKNGKDSYLPVSPLILNAETAQAANWSYELAQVVNGKNNFSLNIGVLKATTNVVEAIRSATENKIYVPKESIINNAYLVIQRKEEIPTVCQVKKQGGGSAYWLGYSVFADKSPILLDFTGTGIDLNKIIIDAGVFSNIKILSNYKLLINTKPTWVTQKTPGYIGFRASNYAPLATPLVAVCDAG